MAHDDALNLERLRRENPLLYNQVKGKPLSSLPIATLQQLNALGALRLPDEVAQKIEQAAREEDHAREASMA